MKLDYIAFKWKTARTYLKKNLSTSGNDMKTKLVSLISTGITIGFLMAMGVVALLRSVINGQSPELEIAFMLMVVMMGASLIYYVSKNVE